MPAEVVRIEQVRAVRDVESARKARRAKMIGNCGKGVREECGMLDVEACRIHAPLLPQIE